MNLPLHSVLHTKQRLETQTQTEAHRIHICGSYAVFILFDQVPCTMAEGGKDDDELNIPRAALNKMIKELVPNIRIANDSRELILNCCTEFIHLLSSEANDICNKQQKKTISPEHILAGT